MVWGVFNKIKNVAKKVGEGIKTGAKFVQEKIIPGAKKFLNDYGDLVPYGSEVKNIVNKVDKYSKNVEDISEGNLPDDVREWIKNKVRA